MHICVCISTMVCIRIRGQLAGISSFLSCGPWNKTQITRFSTKYLFWPPLFIFWRQGLTRRPKLPLNSQWFPLLQNPECWKQGAQYKVSEWEWPHKLIDLNVWFPVDYLGGLGGKVSLGSGLWGSKSPHHAQSHCFSALHLWVRSKLSATAVHPCLSATTLPTMMTKPSGKCFLFKLPSSWRLFTATEQ